jgi:Zn-dependent protease with chaperone function
MLYTMASLTVAAVWRRLALTADWLFALRMFPAALSIFVVVFCALPAYWALEPLETGEAIGLKLAAAALLAILGIAVSAGRVLHSWMVSRRLTAEWMRTAQPLPVDGLAIQAYRVEHDFPVLAIAGIIRPRLFIANRLLESMSPEQMAAALAHEAGHLAAGDNLRRLLLLLFPVFGARNGLDQAWAEGCEIAADAYAARQGAGFALDLASALIQVARMVPAGRTVAFPPCMQLLASDSVSGLTGRVHRLIEMSQQEAAQSEPDLTWPAVFSVAAISGVLIAYWNSPVSLHAMHELLEGFVRLLS